MARGLMKPRLSDGSKTAAPLAVLAAIAAMAALLSTAACSGEGEKKEPVVTVQTAVVKSSELRQLVSAEAVLYPLHQAAITPKISAPVRKFLVMRGSRVRQGQLLAELENRDLAAAEVENKGAYEQAQAEYQSATAASIPEEMQKAELDAKAAREAFDAQQKLFESRQNLYRQGALPRRELDLAGVSLTQARNQYEIAQKHLAALQAVTNRQHIRAAAAQLEAAKGKYLGAAAQLAYSQIHSPIDGVVTDRPLYPGEMASAGTPLLTVMDVSEIVARAHIPQQQAALLKLGDAATITAASAEGEVPAKVTVVSPATDPNSTTVEVWAQAKNPGNHLRPGTTVRLTVIARTIPDAVVIPATALLTNQEGPSVMIVGADGRAHQQTVEVGVRQENEVQITRGLKSGERVVTVGAYGLPDKTRIQDASEQPRSGSMVPGSGSGVSP